MLQDEVEGQVDGVVYRSVGSVLKEAITISGTCAPTQAQVLDKQYGISC